MQRIVKSFGQPFANIKELPNRATSKQIVWTSKNSLGIPRPLRLKKRRIQACQIVLQWISTIHHQILNLWFNDHAGVDRYSLIELAKGPLNRHPSQGLNRLRIRRASQFMMCNRDCAGLLLSDRLLNRVCPVQCTQAETFPTSIPWYPSLEGIWWLRS